MPKVQPLHNEGTWEVRMDTGETVYVRPPNLVEDPAEQERRLLETFAAKSGSKPEASNLFKITGLKSTPELNDQIGHLTQYRPDHYDPEKDRWIVQLECGKKSIKACNLTWLPEGLRFQQDEDVLVADLNPS